MGPVDIQLDHDIEVVDSNYVLSNHLENAALKSGEITAKANMATTPQKQIETNHFKKGNR